MWFPLLRAANKAIVSGENIVHWLIVCASEPIIWAYHITGSNQPSESERQPRNELIAAITGHGRTRTQCSLSRTEQWLCTCVISLCTFPLYNSALSGEDEPRRLVFYFKYIVVLRIKVYDSFESDKQSKWVSSTVSDISLATKSSLYRFTS